VYRWEIYSERVTNWSLREFCNEELSTRIGYRIQDSKLCVEVTKTRNWFRIDIYANCVKMWRICKLFTSVKTMIFRIDVKSMQIVYGKWSLWYFVSKRRICKFCIDITAMQIVYRCDVCELCINVKNFQILFRCDFMQFVFR